MSWAAWPAIAPSWLPPFCGGWSSRAAWCAKPAAGGGVCWGWEKGSVSAGRAVSLALEEAQSSSRAADFLTRRLQLLPPDTLQLLTAGAVLGKEFELDV